MWTSLTPADLYPYLAAEQVDALRAEALAIGQPDPLPQLINDAVLRIRAEVAANSANRLSQTPDAIPAELRSAAIALIIEAAQTRLPGLDLGDDQIRAANQARALLQRVAKGQVAITPPADPIPVPPPPVAPSASYRVDLIASRANHLSSHSLRAL